MSDGRQTGEPALQRGGQQLRLPGKGHTMARNRDTVHERSSLGQLLWLTRLKRQWTFADMAAATGVDAATLWRLEREGRSPRRATLERLAKGLGYPFDQLWRLAGKPRPPDHPMVDGTLVGSEEERAELIFRLQHSKLCTVKELRTAVAYLQSEDPCIRGAVITAIGYPRASRFAATPTEGYAVGIIEAAEAYENSTYVRGLAGTARRARANT